MNRAKIVLTRLLLFSLCFVLRGQEKIKLYALYTPSHEILKSNYFLPSLQDDFDVIIEKEDQACISGKFMSDGWTQTTLKKVDLIIRAIHDNWGNFFVFSDVDIQFFCPIQDTIIHLISDRDLIIQKNTPDGVLCSGFFVCRGNEKTLALWSDVKKKMEDNPSQSDQISLNQCIKRHGKKNPYNVTWDYLPETFFGGGTLTGCLWSPGKKLPVPFGIMVHHANFARGIKHKVAQLEYVKKVVLKRKKKQAC